MGVEQSSGWRRHHVRKSVVLCMLAAMLAAGTLRAETSTDSSMDGASDASVFLPNLSIPNDLGNVPQDVVSADFNGDNIADLAIAFAFEDKVKWYSGDGAGGFTFEAEHAVGVNNGPLNDLPRALIAEDFDGDGFTDLAVLASGNPDLGAPFFPTFPSLGILYGKPLGGFEAFRPLPLANAAVDSPPLFSLRLAAGQINGDDLPDLVAGHFDSRQMSILINRGRRTWAPPRVEEVATPGPGPVAFEIVDLDFSGNSEIVVANHRDVQIWSGAPNETFGQSHKIFDGIEVTDVAAADFDQNGLWDLAIIDGSKSRLTVLMNVKASGEVQRRVDIPLSEADQPVRLLIYDANLDGRDDLAVIYLDSGGGDLFFGRRDPQRPLRFVRRFNTANQPRAIASGDFNQDGFPDLAIANEGDEEDSTNSDLAIDLSRGIAVSGEDDFPQSFLAPGEQIEPYLSKPRGLAWDEGRNSLWVIDRKERKILRLTEEAEIRKTILLDELNPVPLDPTDLAVDGAGDLWFTDRLAHQVYRLRQNPSSTALQGFSTADAGIMHPAGIAYNATADRIAVSDEIAPRVAVFARNGSALGEFEIDNQNPLLDLAWHESSGRLLGIPKAGGGAFDIFGLDNQNNAASRIAEIPGEQLGQIFAGTTFFSVAVEPDGNRFWLLTDRGALVSDAANIGLINESNIDALLPTLTSIRELALLRDIRAVTVDAEGNWLLGDSGLLASLVRVDRAGRVLERIQLNAIDSPPMRIAGLSRTSERTYILDGNSGDISVLRDDGTVEAPLPGLPAMRQAAGLHVDRARSRILVGSPGRINIFDLNGTKVAERPMPANVIPGSLSRGRDRDEIALFAPFRSSFCFFDPDILLKKTRVESRRLPLGFQPRAATLLSSQFENLLFAGSGETTVLTTRIEGPPTAVPSMTWELYR